MLIIWDYFGVMAQDGFWYESRAVADGFHKSEHMYQIAEEVDLGHMSWDEFCIEVSKDIQVPPEVVRKRFLEHQINKVAVSTIRALNSSGHTCVLLSNASHEYLLPVMDKLGLHSLFSDIFVSSQMGVTKPDPKAFMYVLEATRFTASQAIMIDDNVRNIDVAIDLGMKGIVYEPGMDIYKKISELTKN